MAASPPMTTTSSTGYGTPAGSYSSSSDYSERYEQALRRVENLAKIVVVLAVIVLVLLVV